jgi:hypothetical protein
MAETTKEHLLFLDAVEDYVARATEPLLKRITELETRLAAAPTRGERGEPGPPGKDA